MKLLMQSLKSGDTYFEEIPLPVAGKNFVLVESVCSLVSSGTEKMLVQFGKSNWIQKIAQQPEKFKQLVQKIQTDGLVNTFNAVAAKSQVVEPAGGIAGKQDVGAVINTKLRVGKVILIPYPCRKSAAGFI